MEQAAGSVCACDVAPFCTAGLAWDDDHVVDDPHLVVDGTLSWAWEELSAFTFALESMPSRIEGSAFHGFPRRVVLRYKLSRYISLTFGLIIIRFLSLTGKPNRLPTGQDSILVSTTGRGL